MVYTWQDLQLIDNKYLVRIKKRSDSYNPEFIIDLICRNSNLYDAESYNLFNNLKEIEDQVECEFMQDSVPKVTNKNL